MVEEINIAVRTAQKLNVQEQARKVAIEARTAYVTERLTELAEVITDKQLELDDFFRLLKAHPPTGTYAKERYDNRDFVIAQPVVINKSANPSFRLAIGNSKDRIFLEQYSTHPLHQTAYSSPWISLVSAKISLPEDPKPEPRKKFRSLFQKNNDQVQVEAPPLIDRFAKIAAAIVENDQDDQLLTWHNKVECLELFSRQLDINVTELYPQVGIST